MLKYFAKSTRNLINFETPSILFNKNLKNFTEGTQTKMTPEEYEREWTKLYEIKMKEKMDYLNKELSESDKQEVEFIFDHIKSLTKDELKYLAILLKVKETKLNGISPLEFNSLHPTNMTKMTNLWPKENPNWHNTSSLQSTITSFQGGKVQAGNLLFNSIIFLYSCSSTRSRIS
jgi:hypothetical protein